MSSAQNAKAPVFELPAPIPELTKEEFQLYQGLVERESGIHLGAKNRAMLVSRLWKRLRALDLNSFSAYYRLVKANPEEMVLMLDCICTNETHFFREPAAFDCLRQHVFPEWIAAADTNQRTRTLRAWSAACSSGEEPYSLAMMLLAEFPENTGWKTEVLGTDLSTKVLARASKGVWPSSKLAGVPVEYQRQFLLKGFGPDHGKIKATDELRKAVRFQRLNLIEHQYEVFGPFDLIFCRNVIIYFEWETKLKVIDRLGRYLAPNGYLFLGHAESLHGMTDQLESVKPKVFRSPDGRAGRGALCILQRRDSVPRSPYE
jgi:chemotaxis protein methyltransferase CheR